MTRDKLRRAYHDFIIERADHYVSKELLFEAGFDYAVKLLESEEGKKVTFKELSSPAVVLGYWLKEQK